ncbi:TlpA family protein disulfide reductase [Algibacter aquimarinus]|uniref:Thioredoxin domain-containing protein n=1 Tax=Algibacter aquimarinus TaxID=1136748 RepID=A0ABP9H3B9_9FLAO
MNKFLFILFIGVVSSHLYAQKSIENPEYGFATYPGEIVKIEMLDTATVLYFKLKKLPWGYFHLHEESYIQDLSGDEKLFVTKLTGAKFKRNDFPPSGEVMYQLYFPPLSKTVKTIDFGVEKERGGGIFDIVIQEDENSLLLPKELRGNWLLTDGSNRWDYGFNSKNAIVNGAVWNYKSIDGKGKKYTIILENGDRLKTIYAKLGKDGMVYFGNIPKSLKSYSLTKVDNPNLRLSEDTKFENITFGLDSTTYSGMIKGFSSKMKQKTFMIHINNTFKGNQETHLVKINDDGTFKSKFPLTHPQTVFIRMGPKAFTIFLEPNKETFHYVAGKESLFMRDNAQVNSDLQSMDFIRFFNHQKIRAKIGITSPEDYKKICLDVRDKELKTLEDFKIKHFVSAKALQIKKIQIELSTYQNALGYGMYRNGIKRQNEKAKTDSNKIPFEDFDVNEAYYDFIPKDIIDNKLVLLSGDYYFFVNRLIYADIFEANQSSGSRTTLVEFANWLQKNKKVLTIEELEMVEMSKQIETPEIMLKEANFRKAHGDVEQAFLKKHRDDLKNFNVYMKTNKIKSKYNSFILDMAEYLKENGGTFSDEEIKMMEALKTLKTSEEIKAERHFNKTYGMVRGLFYRKYGSSSSEMSRTKYYSNRDKRIKDYFGKSDAFLYDVVRFQTASMKLKDYEVYSDEELKLIQNELENPFLVNYLAVENERTKETIEANKTKGGYTVNTIENTEGDELFDAMLKKFKGKVVYVDFWATWCGPCMSGIKRIAPLKEEMKNEDVVFLYVTNQTSPTVTWENAITNIKGEHYRVSADEWNYLSQKFKISGIPHYTLVDRNGKVVKPKLRPNSNNKLKGILKAELERKL